MKKTMTKTKMTAEQAREYLKDKYVPVKNRTEALIASKMLKELGLRDLHENQRYKGGNLSIGQDSTFVRFTGEYVWSAKNRETELPLSDLLSIEVVEEPDYRQKFDSVCKYIDRLQEKYDENGYDCSPEVKLQRIEDHVDSAIKLWKEERDNYKTRFEECVELLKQVLPWMTGAIGDRGDNPDSNPLVKKAKQFIEENKGV